MSFFIDLCIATHPATASRVRDELRLCVAGSGMHLTVHSDCAVPGMPCSYLTSSADFVCVSIDGAEYLLDPWDYAPDANIGFPPLFEDRVSMLIECVREIALVAARLGSQELVVALTDNNEIEAVERGSLESFPQLVRSRSHEVSPPNVAFVIGLTATPRPS